MKAVQINSFGSPEVLQYQDVPDPKTGNGEVLLEVQAVGINYLDINIRKGLLKGPLPRILGIEAAGVVREIGPGVSGFKEGDRIAYAGAAAGGSYAELVPVSAARLIKLPKGVDAKSGAAAMLQGMTAHYLCHSTYQVKKGDRVLVHAGAGGVGLLLIQMVKKLGGYVFATVSTEEKAKIARDAGADQVILYTQQDFAEEITKATNGEGVPVVYDSVGKTTFDGSLASVARRGLLVLYGQASGPVPPLDLGRLYGVGSQYLTRPSLQDYTGARQELEKRAGDVLGWVKSGELKLRIEHVFPLSQAGEAHRQLESRATTGKVVLIP